MSVLKANVCEDDDAPDALSMNAETALKHTVNSVARKFKFILKDKKKVERLAKRLCYYNDSLDKMTSRQEQESSRRRLRTHFSTQDPEKLHLLQQAAALLEHHDIETMASSRSVLETGYPVEHRSRPPEKEDGIQGLHGYRLEYHELDFHGIPFSADQPRAVATFQRETVLVDWRCCRDDTWRKENPIAFRQRTENLTRILNSDLGSLNLSVLHCVGYIDRNTTVTGYAFRLPPEANSKQKPLTLHHLLTNVTKPSDIPDLGERFEVAKALVSTVFEFHNMGWMHKNVQSKNILFWPKPGTQDEPNLSKPYLVGFDISRPNQPGEVSEKPFSNNEDDLYRHPDYKGSKPNSFQPPFDIYSLGIVLFEIGLWAAISRQNGSQVRRGARPPLKSHVSYTDPAFIENVMKGPVMDLKQYMGVRYRDAVITCLNGTFDKIWEQSKGEDRMQLYQDEVQSKLVDIIALCNA